MFSYQASFIWSLRGLHILYKKGGEIMKKLHKPMKQAKINAPVVVAYSECGVGCGAGCGAGCGGSCGVK
jgi:hypothetical protein